MHRPSPEYRSTPSPAVLLPDISSTARTPAPRGFVAARPLSAFHATDPHSTLSSRSLYLPSRVDSLAAGPLPDPPSQSPGSHFSRQTFDAGSPSSAICSSVSSGLPGPSPAPRPTPQDVAPQLPGVRGLSPATPASSARCWRGRVRRRPQRVTLTSPAGVR